MSEQTPETSNDDVPPKLDQSGAELLEARRDAQFFGTGFLSLTLGEDGNWQYRRIDPRDIMINGKKGCAL